MEHMKFEPRFESIISNVFSGNGPNREDCTYLLGFEPHSLESTHMMSIANDMYRARTDNAGVIYAQIGIDVAPCSANCQFCAFARDHFSLEAYRIRAVHKVLNIEIDAPSLIRVCQLEPICPGA